MGWSYSSGRSSLIPFGIEIFVDSRTNHWIFTIRWWYRLDIGTARAYLHVLHSQSLTAQRIQLPHGRSITERDLSLTPQFFSCRWAISKCTSVAYAPRKRLISLFGRSWTRWSSYSSRGFSHFATHDRLPVICDRLLVIFAGGQIDALTLPRHGPRSWFHWSGSGLTVLQSCAIPPRPPSRDFLWPCDQPDHDPATTLKFCVPRSLPVHFPFPSAILTTSKW
jgi:hypothetical protein